MIPLANSTADGSVVINVDMNVSDAEKELTRLKGRVFKLESDIEEKESRRNDLVERRRRLEAEINDLQKGRKTLGGESFADNSAIDEKISDIRKEVFTINKEIGTIDTSLDGLTSTLDFTKMRFGEVSEIAKTLTKDFDTSTISGRLEKASYELAQISARGKGLGDDEYDEAYRKLALLTSEARAYQKELSKTPEQAQREYEIAQRTEDKRQEQIAKEAAAAIQAQIAEQRLMDIKENAAVVDQHIVDLNEELVHLKNRQAELQQAGVGLGHQEYDDILQRLNEINLEFKGYEDGLLQVEKDTDKIGKKTDEASKAMGRLRGRILELAKSAFIFNVISRGLTSLQQLTMKYLKTNEETRNAIAQLKGALLTLAQPLIEIVIPAFTLFVNILTRIITAVAQLVSSLFGKTIKQSKDGAKALYKEANAIGAVGEAAEEAAGSLAGFDEINTINTENAKGAGGLGGTGDEIMPDFDFTQEGLDWLSEILGESAKWVATALLLGGIALVAIGACMGNLLLVLAGLFLLGAGITIGEETGTLQSWIDTLGLKNVAEFVVLAILLAGIAIVAIGAATGNIFMVLAGLVLIGTTIAYANASGMMKSWAEEQVSRAASYVTAALLLGGIALVVIGAATANILMVLAGLGLLAAGIYVGLESETLEAWAKVLGLDSVFDYVVAGIQLAGIALIAIGAAMANIAMVIAGGIILGIGITAELIGEETLKSWWEILKLTTIQQWVGVVLLLGGIALIAIGAAMANILMVLAGIGMLAVGTVVAATDGNLKSWVEVLELGKIMNWVTTALLLGGIALIVFGIVSGNILMILAGLGLLGAGVAVGTTSGTFQKWIDAIIKGLKDLKRDAKAWWDSNMAKFFTLEYWEGLGKDVIDGFMDGLKNAWDGLTSWFSGVWDDLFGNRKVSVGINRSGNFGSGGSGSFGGSRISASAIPPLPASKIPALARGAVIPPNREFLAVLGDQRNGTNLEAPEGLIRQLFQEETGRGNAEILQLLQAILAAIKDGHVIMVGETVLGRTTIRAINNITISSGKQMLKI